jgi:glucosyl-3-phosphoglycerate synthase
VAEDQIKKYSDDASFSNLIHDRDAEENLVREVFRNSIVYAGELLTSPYRMTERFLRFVNSHDEFKPFLDRGLAEAILSVEAKNRERLFEIPQTVSWERVANKMPRIFYDLIDVVEHEKRSFS